MPIFTHDEVSKYARRLLQDMGFLEEAATNNTASGSEDDPVAKEYYNLMMDLWTCRHKIATQVKRLEDAVELAESEGHEHVTDARRNNSYAPQSPDYGRYPSTEHDEEGSPRYEPQSPSYLPIYQLPVSPRYEPSSPLGYQPTTPKYEPTSPNYHPTAPSSSTLLPDYESPSLLYQDSYAPAAPSSSTLLPDYESPSMLHQDDRQQAANNIFPHNSSNSDSGFVDLTTHSPNARPQRPLWLLPPTTGEDQAVNQQQQGQTKKRKFTPPPPDFFANAGGGASWGRSSSLYSDDGSGSGSGFGSDEDQQGFDDMQAAAQPQFQVNGQPEDADAFIQGVNRLIDDGEISAFWLGGNGGEDKNEDEQEADGGGDGGHDENEVQFLGRCCRKRRAPEAPLYGTRSAVRRRLF